MSVPFPLQLIVQSLHNKTHILLSGQWIFRIAKRQFWFQKRNSFFRPIAVSPFEKHHHNQNNTKQKCGDVFQCDHHHDSANFGLKRYSGDDEAKLRHSIDRLSQIEDVVAVCCVVEGKWDESNEL